LLLSFVFVVVIADAIILV